MAELVDYNGNNIEESLLATSKSPGLMSAEDKNILGGIYQRTFITTADRKITIISHNTKWLYDKTAFFIFGTLNSNSYIGIIRLYNTSTTPLLYPVYSENQGIKISIYKTLYIKNDPTYGGAITAIVLDVPEYSVGTVVASDPFTIFQGEYTE